MSEILTDNVNRDSNQLVSPDDVVVLRAKSPLAPIARPAPSADQISLGIPLVGVCPDCVFPHSYSNKDGKKYSLCTTSICKGHLQIDFNCPECVIEACQPTSGWKWDTCNQPGSAVPLHRAPPVTALPESARRVFTDPQLFKPIICWFCRLGQNVQRDADGKVTQVFCRSCCSRMSGLPEMQCRGAGGRGCVSSRCRGAHGGAECTSNRYVDALGHYAPLCRCCDSEEKEARKKREHRRGGRRQATLGEYVRC